MEGFYHAACALCAQEREHYHLIYRTQQVEQFYNWYLTEETAMRAMQKHARRTPGYSWTVLKVPSEDLPEF